jgi:predicted TIM-barrel fold metal-dependent hydrolase
MVDLVEQLLRVAGVKPELELRDDPVPRDRRYRIVSVDDHFVEPPTAFEGRLPRRFADRGPRVLRKDGADYWSFEDRLVPLLGTDAIQSWEPGKGYKGPVMFDEIRPATWQVHERVKDMDINGVAASLNFPSAPFGFAGQTFMKMQDKELGLASMKAWNDWVHEEWFAPQPTRIIPCQVTWLLDPGLAAAEIHRNASRGFKALAFSENPDKLDLPSIYSDYWDPVFRACEETDTVINLHVGSSSQTFIPSENSAHVVLGILFPINSFAAAADWLFSGVLLRFPGLRIVMSEGGIGWVPMLIDRLHHMSKRQLSDWPTTSLSPEDVLRRNFWYATYADPTTIKLYPEIGPERIMVETDYPHPDSTWPDTQSTLASQLEGLPDDVVRLITHQNALDLYRHSLG